MTIADDAPLRILLVEDNEDDVLYTKRVLAKSGVVCELEVAKDGRSALEALARYKAAARGRRDAGPNLVLLDVGLPGMDGLEVLRRMKADPALRNIPVAILTGSRDRAHLETSVELGTNLYLNKPVAIVDIVYIVLGVHKYWLATQGALSRRRRDRGANAA
jgi:two-component system response regulator